MENLQIIYEHNKPYGIRNKNGFLFFFVDIIKFQGQEDRYKKEIKEQQELADYLLNILKQRANTSIHGTEKPGP